MIKIGNIEASNIMIGNEQALKIFVGDTLAWLNYIEIEYLESSGTQWIDTGIIPNETTKVQFKFENLEPTGDVIIGYYTSSDLNDWRLFNYNQTAYYDLPLSSGKPEGLRYYGGTLAKNVAYEIELGNCYVKNMITDSNIIGRSSPVSLFTGISTITLNHHKSNNTNSKNRWYYVKIFDQNNLIRDLIPIRIGQVGYMYDKISKQLFANQGTGNFILGLDK